MTIADIAIIYVAVALIVAVCAVWIGIDPQSSHRAQRNAARVALLAIFWPTLAVYAAIVGIAKAWRIADWRAR